MTWLMQVIEKKYIYILCFCKNVKQSLIAGDVIILIIVMAYKFWSIKEFKDYCQPKK